MTNDNTLLGRCTVAFTETLMGDVPPTTEQKAAARRGVASVLEHLAAEIIVMHQREPRLSVFELARVLTDAAGKEVNA